MIRIKNALYREYIADIAHAVHAANTVRAAFAALH